MKRKVQGAVVAGAMTTLLLSGCLGGSDSEQGSQTIPTTTVTGLVADGYLEGTKVCLDKNVSGSCDAGEPSAVTDAAGRYTLTGVVSGDEKKYPLLVEVSKDTIDHDDGKAVGKAYFLTAPAGRTEFVSPLTSMIALAMQNDASLNADSAEAKVKADLALPATVSLYADYVANGVNADYQKTHQAAKMVANSLMANYETALAGMGQQAQRRHLHTAMLSTAYMALASQGGNFDPNKKVGSEDAVTLMAMAAEREAKTQTGNTQLQDVTIDFDVLAGNQSVACGVPLTLANKHYETAAEQQTVGQIVDLRFYVANIGLVDDQGNYVPVALSENANQQNNVALLDFEDKTGKCIGDAEMYQAIVGKVKPGNYVAVAFTLGVPVKSADGQVAMNHSNPVADATPMPLRHASMGWSWQSGRKFTKIEFAPDVAISKPTADNPAATTPKWNVHIGSTGCSGDPMQGSQTACSNPNRLSVKLDGFAASSKKVVLDLASLFAHADLTNDRGGAAGCMSGVTDPECAPIFKSLGLGLTTGLTLSGAEGQTVFAVKAK